MKLKLTKRLQAIVDMCVATDTIVDVATDHGIVPITLANMKIVNKIIATDINVEPLKKCEENKNIYLIDKNFDFRTILSDGIKNIDKDMRCAVVITGIGYDLMSGILKDINDYNIDYLILSVHNKVPEFRKFLHSKNLYIEDERIVYDNKKYYFIEKCRKLVDCSDEKVDDENIIHWKEEEYLYSKILIDKKDKLLQNYMDEMLITYNRILKDLDENNMRYKEIQHLIELTKNVYDKN